MDCESVIDMGTIVTLVVGVISALAIILSVSIGFKNSLKLQRENFRQRLKLEIYNDLKPHISSVYNAASEAGEIPISIGSAFNFSKVIADAGGTPAPIKHRSVHILEAVHNLSKATTNLIGFIEQHEIVNPNLEVFRLALGHALLESGYAWQAYYQKVISHLPVDMPTGSGVIPRPIPTPEQTEELEELCWTYFGKTTDISGYVMDLSIEVQNIFLGDLFGNKLNKRKPEDPKKLVLSTEPEIAEELKKHFNDLTAKKKESEIKKKESKDKK